MLPAGIDLLALRVEFEAHDRLRKVLAHAYGLTVGQLRRLSERGGWHRRRRSTGPLPIELFILRQDYETAPQVRDVASDAGRTPASLYGLACRNGWKRAARTVTAFLAGVAVGASGAPLRTWASDPGVHRSPGVNVGLVANERGALATIEALAFGPAP